MVREMNRVVFAAIVFISASCATGFPMLLGEPEIQEGDDGMLDLKAVGPDSSDGFLTQQMQQPSMTQENPSAVISSEDAVNVGQMQQEGNTMPQQVPTELSSDLQLIQQQAQFEENMQPTKAETVPSDQTSDMTMKPDQPTMDTTPSDQSQILAESPVQAVEESNLCPPASDCPEKEVEMVSSPSVQTPSPTSKSLQPEAEHKVVLEPGDKEDDAFTMATSTA